MVSRCEGAAVAEKRNGVSAGRYSDMRSADVRRGWLTGVRRVALGVALAVVSTAFDGATCLAQENPLEDVHTPPPPPPAKTPESRSR